MGFTEPTNLGKYKMGPTGFEGKIWNHIHKRPTFGTNGLKFLTTLLTVQAKHNVEAYSSLSNKRAAHFEKNWLEHLYFFLDL